MMMISFQVEVIPVAKGRPRFAKRGKFVSTYTPEKTKTYETIITTSAKQAMGATSPLEGPLRASIDFYMPIPASGSKALKKAMLEGKEKHIKKPDLDNLIKAVTDAMNGIVYLDDSQIVRLVTRKVYSDLPRVNITIEEYVE